MWIQRTSICIATKCSSYTPLAPLHIRLATPIFFTWHNLSFIRASYVYRTWNCSNLKLECLNRTEYCEICSVLLSHANPWIYSDHLSQSSGSAFSQIRVFKWYWKAEWVSTRRNRFGVTFYSLPWPGAEQSMHTFIADFILSCDDLHHIDMHASRDQRANICNRNWASECGYNVWNISEIANIFIAAQKLHRFEHVQCTNAYKTYIWVWIWKLEHCGDQWPNHV